MPSLCWTISPSSLGTLPDRLCFSLITVFCVFLTPDGERLLLLSSLLHTLPFTGSRSDLFVGKQPQVSSGVTRTWRHSVPFGNVTHRALLTVFLLEMFWTLNDSIKMFWMSDVSFSYFLLRLLFVPFAFSFIYFFTALHPSLIFSPISSPLY